MLSGLPYFLSLKVVDGCTWNLVLVVHDNSCRTHLILIAMLNAAGSGKGTGISTFADMNCSALDFVKKLCDWLLGWTSLITVSFHQFIRHVAKYTLSVLCGSVKLWKDVKWEQGVEVTEGQRKLPNEELHNLYLSPKIIRVVKLRRLDVWERSTHARNEKCLRNFILKTWRTETLVRPRKMILRRALKK